MIVLSASIAVNQEVKNHRTIRFSFLETSLQNNGGEKSFTRRKCRQKMHVANYILLSPKT